MAGTGRKVLLGCGIGCGAVVLQVIVLSVGTGFLFKDLAQSYHDAEENWEILIDRYGTADEYDLPPRGVIPAERMEAFLTVREASDEARGLLEADLAYFDDDANESTAKGLKKVVGKVKAGIGVGSQIGRLLDARNQALLDAGLGIGEYSYIYCLAYYAYLDHAPADGTEGTDDISFGRRGFVHVETGDRESGASQGRFHDTRRDLRRIMKRQVKAIDDEAAAAAEMLDWREQLQRELDRMRDDRDYAPWQTDMPTEMAAALEPYAERLARTYAARVNPFELLPLDD